MKLTIVALLPAAAAFAPAVAPYRTTMLKESLQNEMESKTEEDIIAEKLVQELEENSPEDMQAKLDKAKEEKKKKRREEWYSKPEKVFNPLDVWTMHSHYF